MSIKADKQAKIATQQITITQDNAQTAIEAAKAVVQEVMATSEAVTIGQRNKAASVRPKIGGALVKQPTFNQSFKDKYGELGNFRMEVNNLFQSYNISQAEQVSIIKKKQLGRQGLLFLEAHTQVGQEAYNTMEDPFGTLSEKFRQQHNQTIKFFQYCTPTIYNSENAGE